MCDFTQNRIKKYLSLISDNFNTFKNGKKSLHENGNREDGYG